MNKDYTAYLNKLKGRVHDMVINEPVYSTGFIKSKYPDSLKYALESMHEIDVSHSYKMFSTIRRTQELITQKLKRDGILVDARYQGPHASDTNVRLYGDLELMIILRKAKSRMATEVQQLSLEIVDILDQAQAYNKLDYSSKNRIYIQTREPVCNVSILPTVWVESDLYKEASLEVNRGVCEFNFAKKTKKVYLPFLNLARINSRDRDLGGSLKSVIRLLQALIFDTDEKINITFDEIVGLTYNISTKEMAIAPNQYLSILPNVSLQLNRLITDTNFRESMLSPSRKEFVFGKKQKVESLTKLKKELDGLIADVTEALKSMNKSLMSPIDY